MKQLPSRFRRLDDALASLPLAEPMLLTELDGFLTGVIVCPEVIMPGDWLPIVWGADDNGGAPFDDPADVRWFTDTVMARYNEIGRDLGRGRPQAIFDIDERNGDVLWELWVDGFAEAMALRPACWPALADDDSPAAEALSYLTMLIEIARNESALDSLQINVAHDAAPAGIAAAVLRLHALQARRDTGPATARALPAAKAGRNDPCPCGSGTKFKRCCG